MTDAKKFTFEEYKAALEGAGPKLKEHILGHAERYGELTMQEFIALVVAAYPDDEAC